jgi:hypothetical protein
MSEPLPSPSSSRAWKITPKDWARTELLQRLKASEFFIRTRYRATCEGGKN